MYGQELKHSKLSNWKGRLVFALFGETYPGHLIRFFVNRRYLKKYITGSQLKILEMGSNNGAFAFWLSRNPDNTVIGLEMDKALVKDCYQISNKINRSNLFFVCADASDEMSFKNHFDVIFSTHVLEHILNDQAVLINIFKSLKPGGILILQIPYGDPQKSPSKEAVDNGHVRDGYTELNIRQKLEYAGFEIISATGSVGRIGRFAYRLSRSFAQIRIIINLSILFFPVTLGLFYLEQMAAILRRKEPSFLRWPLVIANRPETV